MTAPTLLLPFEGATSGRDRSGSVTLTEMGSFAYGAGAAPGTQAIDLRASNYVYLDGVVPRLSHTEGAVALRFAPHVAAPAASAYLLRVGSPSAGAYLACYQSTSGSFVYHTRTDGNNTGLTGFGLPTLDAFTDRILEWDATTLAVYGPSGLIASVPRTGTSSETWTDDRINIGFGAGTIDAHVDSVLVLGARPTQAERDTLFAAPSWSWSILSVPTQHPVLKIGAPHIGPLRVGERN